MEHRSKDWCSIIFAIFMDTNEIGDLEVSEVHKVLSLLCNSMKGAIITGSTALQYYYGVNLVRKSDDIDIILDQPGDCPNFYNNGIISYCKYIDKSGIYKDHLDQAKKDVVLCDTYIVFYKTWTFQMHVLYDYNQKPWSPRSIIHPKYQLAIAPYLLILNWKLRMIHYENCPEASVLKHISDVTKLLHSTQMI